MSAPAASASHDFHSPLYSLGWFSTTSLLGLLSSALEHRICQTRHYTLASLMTGLRSPIMLLTGKLLLPIIILLLCAFPYTVLRFDVNNHRGFSPVCLAITCWTNMNVVNARFLIQIPKQRWFVLKQFLSEKNRVVWLTCGFCNVLPTICADNKENNRFFYHWSATWWTFEQNLMFRDLFIILWTYVWRTAYGNQSIVHKELQPKRHFWIHNRTSQFEKNAMHYVLITTLHRQRNTI